MKHQVEVVHTEQGPIGRTLLHFAVPVLLSQLLQELYNAADCVVMGHFAGNWALAAAGVSGLLLSICINFFVGFSSGISVITSRLFGAYDYGRLQKTVSSVFRMVIVTGMLMSALTMLCSRRILISLHCPEEILPSALLYLRICICGLPAQLVYNAGSAILRSYGNTRTSLVLFGLSTVCNLILDLVLVVFLHRGIAGAAAATLFSQYLLAFMVLTVFYCLEEPVRLHLTGKGLPAAEMLYILKDGIPAGLQALFMSISSLMLQVSINQFGPAAIAGMTVYAKLEGCLYLPSFAYGIALTGFIGQNLGAGKKDRIMKAVKLSLYTMTAVILPFSLLLLGLSPVLLKLFSSDPAILWNAHEAVLFTFPVYVIYALNQVYLGAVKGLGNTSYPMLSTLLCYSLFRVLFCRLVIPHFFTMRVVYLSYDISFILMFLLLFPMYRMSCSSKAD